MNINEQILQKLSYPCFDNLFPIEMIVALKDKNGEGYSEAIALLSAQLTLLLKEDLTEEVYQGHDYVKTQHSPTDKPTLADTVISLKEKHLSYKQELLLNMGEADEYKKLCVEYPELQVKLQPKYNSVRERNTKILGSIKAIESLINNKSM
jgi:uncharacterized coiled-coil DUF342 family protein